MDVKEKARCLKQLRYLRGEADQLSRRIGALEAARGGGVRRGRPMLGDAEALKERLALREARCRALEKALGDFIEGIDDSLTRRIMALRYVDGMTWQCVAAHIGERDEQYPRRLHNRYLRRHELPAGLEMKGADAGRPRGKEGEA